MATQNEFKNQLAKKEDKGNTNAPTQTKSTNPRTIASNYLEKMKPEIEKALPKTYVT